MNGTDQNIFTTV